MAVGSAGQPPFGGHAGRVLTVAFRPGGSFLATGGDDGTIRTWDPMTGKQQTAFTAHAGPVRSIAFRPDGAVIASAGDDRTVRVWDAGTGKSQAQLTSHTGSVLSVAYSRDGALIASAGADRRVQIWNAVTGQRESHLGPLPGAVNSVTFSPDGEFVACACSDLVALIWRFGTASEPPRRLEGHTSRVNTVAFSADGSVLASAGGDRSVRIWDVRTGRERTAFDARPGTVNALAFSPDGQVVASAGENEVVLLWSLDSGLVLDRLTGHDAQVNCVAYGLIGETVALATASDDGTARVWNISPPSERCKLDRHTGPVKSVAYRSDGQAIATAGADRAVRIWDARTGSQRSLLPHERPVAAMAYSPHGSRMVTVEEEEATVKIWNTDTDLDPTPIAVCETGHQDLVRAVAYNLAGTAFATASDDETILIWDAKDGAHGSTLTGHIGPVRSVAYRRDGTLVSGGDDGTVRVWNTSTGEQVAVFAGNFGPVWSVASSPSADNAPIAAAGGDGTIVVWDVKDPRQLARIDGQGGIVYSMAYDQAGSMIAAANSDGTVKIWDAVTFEPRAQMTGHTSAVRSVSFSPDGARIATCGDDGTIRLWDTRTGEQVSGSGLGAPRPRPLPLAGVSSDSPSRIDQLGVGRDVDTLAELVAATETRPPLAIAVIGEWGAGKSSVMQLIAEQVTWLAELSHNNRNDTAFATSVSQIHFNAWHYSSDHLWAGLAREMFKALSRSGWQKSSAEIDADVGKLRAERTKRLDDLLARERDVERLTSEMDRAKGAEPPEGLLRWLRSPSYVSRTFGYASREGLKDVRASWRPLLAWAVLAAIAIGMSFRFGSQIRIIVTVAAGLVASFRPALMWIKTWYRTLIDKTNVLYEELDKRRSAAEQRATEARKRLTLVDAQFRLSTFVNDRGNSTVYRQGRGLIGDVHEDLLVLSDNLQQARREWTAGDGQAEPPERIVLYIDDLDRCPPARVVEMLEAVHLILTLDLFIVVVAVDARWMIRSLESHYPEFFDDSNGSSAGNGTKSVAGGNRIAPYDYLDKIFQIPYTLVPPPNSGSARYLRSLLPDPRPPAVPPPAQEPDQATGSGTPQATPASEPDSRARRSKTGQPGKDADDGRAAGHDAPPAATENPGQTRGADAEQAAGSRPVRDLKPPNLRLSHAEIDFMTRLGTLTPSPRATKRMANLYRLVRISIPDEELAAFLGNADGGPYRAVQVLIAILTGAPESTCAIFERILGARADDLLLDVLALEIGEPGGNSSSIARIGATLRRVNGQTAIPEKISEYQKWCPELARYSFRTWGLARELADRER